MNEKETKNLNIFLGEMKKMQHLCFFHYKLHFLRKLTTFFLFLFIVLFISCTATFFSNQNLNYLAILALVSIILSFVLFCIVGVLNSKISKMDFSLKVELMKFSRPVQDWIREGDIPAKTQRRKKSLFSSLKSSFKKIEWILDKKNSSLFDSEQTRVNPIFRLKKEMIKLASLNFPSSETAEAFTTSYRKFISATFYFNLVGFFGFFIGCVSLLSAFFGGLVFNLFQLSTFDFILVFVCYLVYLASISTLGFFKHKHKKQLISDIPLLSYPIRKIILPVHKDNLSSMNSLSDFETLQIIDNMKNFFEKETLTEKKLKEIFEKVSHDLYGSTQLSNAEQENSIFIETLISDYIEKAEQERMEIDNLKTNKNSDDFIELQNDLKNYMTFNLKWYWLLPLVGVFLFSYAKFKEKKILRKKESLIIKFENKAIKELYPEGRDPKGVLILFLSLVLINLQPFNEYNFFRPTVKIMIDEVLADWPNVDLKNYDDFGERIDTH